MCTRRYVLYNIYINIRVPMPAGSEPTISVSQKKQTTEAIGRQVNMAKEMQTLK